MYDYESCWMMKDNYFHHVCYWIDANVEWLIELELESKNLKIRTYSFWLFSKNKPPQAKSLACLGKRLSIS